MPHLSGWRYAGTAALAVILAVLPVSGALAIQGVGVSPTNQTLTLAPGESSTGQLTAINDGDTDVVYRVYATDYKVDNENYQGDFTSSSASADISAVSWFNVPNGDFTVHSHGQAPVSYTITAPKSAAVGGHYAAIFIETVPPKNLAGTVVSRIERLGSIFYITVKGNLTEKGSIQSLTTSLYQSTSPLTGILRMRNDGNVHYLVEGTAQLHTFFGKSGNAVPFKGEVLPSTIRKFDLTLPTSAVGIYRLDVNVKYLDRSETVSKWVLVMPMITLIILCLTLAIIIGLMVWRVVWRNRR